MDRKPLIYSENVVLLFPKKPNSIGSIVSSLKRNFTTLWFFFKPCVGYRFRLFLGDNVYIIIESYIIIIVCMYKKHKFKDHIGT